MMNVEQFLQGRVAAVTGGSRGIGLAIAHTLVARGATVFMVARDAAPLRAAAAEVNGTSTRSTPPARAVEADVRRPADVANLMNEIAAAGPLDILVNSAGVAGFGDVARQPTDEWDQVVATNLSGAFYCARAAIPLLKARGSGWIINIGSLAVHHRLPGRAAYCASKAGLHAFSEVLMQELRFHGIAVCCVAPGPVETTFAANAAPRADTWRLRPLDIARTVVQLLTHDRQVLPSLVELRPRRPETFVRYPLS